MCRCWCNTGAAGVSATPVMLVFVLRRCWCNTGAVGVGVTPVVLVLMLHRRCGCWCYDGADAGVTPYWSDTRC